VKIGGRFEKDRSVGHIQIDHTVGQSHVLNSKTGRSGKFKGRTESLSDSSIFHTKEQGVKRVLIVTKNIYCNFS